MKFLGVFALFMVLAFGSSESENKQKTLEQLIELELGRQKSEPSVPKEQKVLQSRTIDQLIEKERERVNAEPSDTKEKKDLKSGSTGGAIYTRWGRSECPNGSEIVYRGVAGGTHYSHTGGGSNYLCLPLTPEWGYNGGSGYGAIYGAELESPLGFDLSNNGGSSLHDSNVLCVVCRSSSKSSTIMIPARKTCFKGWQYEYEGYLMTQYYAYKAQSDYICVDGSPEALFGGYRNEDGALMYNVVGYCGSLPCPPYVNGRQLVCVVCSK